MMPKFKLTPKEIAKKNLKTKKPKKYEHTKRVVKLCEKFSEELQEQKVSVDTDILFPAAWLHDIGKVVLRKGYDDFHNEAWPITKALDKYPHSFDEDTVLAVIAAHKGDTFQPNTHKMESAILRICDKLDKYNRDDVKHPHKKCDKNMKAIKVAFDMNSDADKAAWEAFEKTYEKIRKKLAKKRKERNSYTGER